MTTAVRQSELWPGLIEKYRSYLPIGTTEEVITLQEGNTPLLPSPKLSEITGMNVFLKCEGANPTGSFKDRGMTMAVTMAKSKGANAVLCASTGNTSASAAAYAARAGIPSYVLLPEGAVALGKLSQALMCQARIIAIQGNFDQALDLAREITDKEDIALVNSVNPDRIAGQMTGAYEICDQLGRAPDYHLIPVGNAGNITAYWRGYKDYHSKGHISSLPQMFGFQAKGAAPIVRGRPLKNPKTIATAIKIGNPASWEGANQAVDESSGGIDAVTDTEILKAYRFLAKEEGVFCEPASASSVAGLLKMAADGYWKGKPKNVVCVLTGHGLKDPSTAMKSIRMPKTVGATFKAVMREIKK